MKVGIIVHSQSGNTLSVAQSLNDSLLAAGHLVALQRLTAVNEKALAGGEVQLQSIPDIGDYEVLFFGAPVHGFSLSPVMRSYLAQVPSLTGRKVHGFVTQHFPYPWLGGHRAISQMKQACRLKEAEVVNTAVINWSSKKRTHMIGEMIDRFTKL